MNWIDYSLASLITIPIVATMILGFYLISKKQSALGMPTIHPFLFYTGKFSMFALWAFFGFVSIYPEYRNWMPLMFQDFTPDVQKLLALIFLVPANLILIPSYFSMGIYTRVGLPTTSHALKINGIYKISRNPMYTSFFFLNTATFLFLPSFLVLFIIVYGTIIHHQIILAEEKFLEEEFGTAFQSYQKSVPRYL